MTIYVSDGGAINTVEVDTRGLNCPLPVLRARKVAKSLSAGVQLLIHCTDPLAKIDIPHFARTDGHRLISAGEENGEIWFKIELGTEVRQVSRK
jgi:tRNA 2-thiouridine synthesizing protein A